MIGISFLHVVHCVNYKIIKLEELCSEYCNVDTFRKSYFEMMHPLLEVDLDPKKNVIFYLQSLKGVWVNQTRIDEGKKKKINLVQLGRGLPYFDATFTTSRI
jgi:hypothetical protein